MGVAKNTVEIWAITKDEKEVHLVNTWDLGDVGSLLKEHYPNLGKDVEKAGIKWSDIKGFKLKLPDDYFVD